MSSHVILIIEDEAAIRSMLRYALELSGFVVHEAQDTLAADAVLTTTQVDCIVLDWMLPVQSGFQYVQQLRRDKQKQHIPVVMLTAKAEEADKVRALESGADDYVVKPFSPPELIARIKAILRRGIQLTLDKRVEYGELSLDVENRQLQMAECQVVLGRLECRLLYFFLTHPDRVYSREALLNHVWGMDKDIDERTVDVHVRRLRKRLMEGGAQHYVQTVHGSGYRFSLRVP